MLSCISTLDIHIPQIITTLNSKTKRTPKKFQKDFAMKEMYEHDFVIPVGYNCFGSLNAKFAFQGKDDPDIRSY